MGTLVLQKKGEGSDCAARNHCFHWHMRSIFTLVQRLAVLPKFMGEIMAVDVTAVCFEVLRFWR